MPRLLPSFCSAFVLVGFALVRGDDVAAGKAYFEENCALCHAAALGSDGNPVNGQGPSLVGVVGRRAASVPGYSYSDALSHCGLTWDTSTLDRYLTDPGGVVPGTVMPIATHDPDQRRNLIAYLATLTATGAVAAPAASSSGPTGVAGTESDWMNVRPGMTHRISIDSLPAPFATKSVGNFPHVVRRTDDEVPSAPPGFTVQLFAKGLAGPRLVRVAPNGDIFVAETGAKRIQVLRAAAGAATPTVNQVYETGLDRPFGLAFYPPGPDPEWLYVANNNSVVRIPYHNGDLTASGEPQVIVPHLTDSSGGHSTRDVAFSPDGKRMFISVGSGSNVASDMSKKTPDQIQDWEAAHGVGAGWDREENRAQILVTDPEGNAPLHPYATGIRNGVGIAVQPGTGTLWTSVNERDGLGDDLVPDYITSVTEGGFYGWPWYYLGNHEDPRHKGERPDLAEKVLAPDVPVQSHSASLEMCFYEAKGGPSAFPAEYRGDIFAAFHGSWNRTIRTGYKVVRVKMKDGQATGEYEDFLTGFVIDNKSVWGRPVGVAVAHDGALLVTEDGSGTMWRVAYSPR
jgi:glucose/arabinose dehydrogenase